jgi:hypothetical protein
LEDLREQLGVPGLGGGTRSPEGIVRLLDLAEQWSSASLPADPLARIRRGNVLRAITAHIIGLISGDRWQRLEHKLLDGRDPTMNEFREAVGVDRYQRELALDLSHQVERFCESQPDKRAGKLAFALRMHARQAGVQTEDPRFAEFLLRLSSEPASLLVWPAEEVKACLHRALASPVIVRAARYVVLVVSDHTGAESDDELYAGWAWE